MLSARKIAGQIRAITPWSIPLKLVVSALLGVFGGAGLLGFISEYATYNYAIYFGIRPPLEGIPYLRAAVAFASLFLLLSGALVFAVIVFSLRSFAWYIDAIPRLFAFSLRLFGLDAKRSEQRHGHALAALRARPLWQLVLGSLLLTVLLLAVLMFAGHPNVVTGRSEFDESMLKGVLAVQTFIVVLAVAKPSSIWWNAIVVTVAYFATCIYILFSPLKYSELLRILGYGGGLSVRLELRDSSASRDFDPDSHQLMLRTNEAVIIYDRNRGTFSEIPREQVHRIVHDSGGMRHLPYFLPERVHRWWGN